LSRNPDFPGFSGFFPFFPIFPTNFVICQHFECDCVIFRKSKFFRIFFRIFPVFYLIFGFFFQFLMEKILHYSTLLNLWGFSVRLGKYSRFIPVSSRLSRNPDFTGFSGFFPNFSYISNKFRHMSAILSGIASSFKDKNFPVFYLNIDFWPRGCTVGPESGSGGHSENCIFVKFGVKWYYFTVKKQIWSIFETKRILLFIFDTTKLLHYTLKVTVYSSLFSKLF